MSYFPLFLDLRKRKVLLVGGGGIAHFKFTKLLQFDPECLKVVAIEVCSQMIDEAKPYVEFHKRPFMDSDIDGMDLVIVAVDDIPLQSYVYSLCQAQKILCNCVDDLEHCDFIFSSLIQKGDITIAINTSGKVPGFGVALKDYIISVLPENMDGILKELMHLRSTLPKGKERMQRIREESASFFKRIGPGVSK